MKNLNLNVVLFLIIVGIGVLAYTSYRAGFNASENDLESLLMTMTLDSNFVTAGLYQELPNKVRKTMSFYIEDAPTSVNDIKLYAQVKYITIGGEILNISNGSIWNLIKKDRVFQRKFDKKQESNNKDFIPESPFADNNTKNNSSKKLL